MLLTPSKSAKTPAVKITSILIDPFKQCLVRLLVNWADQPDIRVLLDCDLIQSVPLGEEHLVWIDESGLLREPFVYPQFMMANVNGNAPLTGYGLITGVHRTWADMEVRDCTFKPEELSVVFESWEKRINPDLCIDQVLRCYYDR